MPDASPSKGIGQVVFYLVFAFFLVSAIGALRIPALTTFMNQVLTYLPNVIAAIIIFVVAAAIAGAAGAALVKVMGVTPTAKIAATVLRGLPQSDPARWSASSRRAQAPTFETIAGFGRPVPLKRFSASGPSTAYRTALVTPPASQDRSTPCRAVDTAPCRSGVDPNMNSHVITMPPKNAMKPAQLTSGTRDARAGSKSRSTLVSCRCSP